MPFCTTDVEALLAQGVADGAFPGAVAMWGPPSEPPNTALAGLRGRSRNALPVTADLIYDLASLTKVLATTSLAMIFFEEGRLDLDLPLSAGPLARYFHTDRPSGADWSVITPTHLLTHQSGLPPWRPFYRSAPPSRKEPKFTALRSIRQEPPQAAPGERTIYSDLNFILLGFLLEEIGEAGLDLLFRDRLARPLNISAGFKPRQGPLAPTEDGFRYGGPVGHPEALLRGPVPLGQVHDDNAAWLGGVAGHAGLFASAGDVWTLAAGWAGARAGQKSSLFSQRALDTFLRPRPSRNDSGRPLGFNIKREVSSLAASNLSESAVGHLGYTGASLWWEPDKNFIWLFLSNRVHYKAWNPAWVPGDFIGGPRSPDSKPYPGTTKNGLDNRGPKTDNGRGQNR